MSKREQLFVNEIVWPNGARWRQGASAPTTGTAKVGDRIMDVASAAGGTEGWVCVTAGSPGVWKAIGAVAA